MRTDVGKRYNESYCNYNIYLIIFIFFSMIPTLKEKKKEKKAKEKKVKKKKVKVKKKKMVKK